MTVVIERLPEDGLARIAEIDRSEVVRARYRQAGERLDIEAVDERVPDFSADGDFHSVRALIEEWQPVVDAGGVIIGATRGESLAGIAMLGLELAPGIQELALLFVDRDHRRHGVASALLDEIERLARHRRAQALYVSSVPSDSAVGFYRSRGFAPTEPLPEPYAKEPEDIHMRLPLIP